MRRRQIGDPENKKGLPPCDHALAMAIAWTKRKDRIDSYKDTEKHEESFREALRESLRWYHEFDRLLRSRHGIVDISSDSDRRLHSVWIGESTSGDRVLLRCPPGRDGPVAFAVARCFLRHLCVAHARDKISTNLLSGRSETSFRLSLKREVKVGNKYLLEDTEYVDTMWQFGANWKAIMTIDEPLLCGGDHNG